MKRTNEHRWRKVIVPVVDQGSSLELPLTIPFPAVELATVPDHVQRLPIREPLHVTLLVFQELLNVASADISEWANEHTPEQALRHALLLGRFYDTAYRDKIQNASRMEFRNPAIRVPEYTDIYQAPGAISAIAGATTLIQAFALHAVASHIEGISRVQGAGAEVIATELAGVARVFDSVILVKNGELIEDHGVSGRFDVTPAIRLIPPDVPRLLITPRRKGD